MLLDTEALQNSNLIWWKSVIKLVNRKPTSLCETEYYAMCSEYLNPIAYQGGEGFLSHPTRILAATLKPLKLWLPNFVTSYFYLFATI